MQPGLNYRMHNKLFVVDNEISIVGGRNIGDEYFRAAATMNSATTTSSRPARSSTRSPGASTRSGNSPMAIPIEALAEGKPSAQDPDYRGVLAAHHAKMIDADAPRHAQVGHQPAAQGDARRQVIARLGHRAKSSMTARKKPRYRTVGKAVPAAASPRRGGETGPDRADRRIALPACRDPPG